MKKILHRSVLVLLTITMAACTSVDEDLNPGGSGGTAGTGATAGTGGTGGMAGTGGGGGTPAPTVSLSATPISVATGTVALLSWEVSDADSCEALGAFWSGARLAEDDPEERFIYENSRFELSCTGLGGERSDEVDVAINTSQLLVSVDMDFYLVKAGDSFDVDVTVSNPGSQTVQNVFINLLIPQHVEIDEGALPVNATCSDQCEAGDSIQWAIGDLSAGALEVESVVPTVALTVPEDANIDFEVVASAMDQPDAMVVETTIEGESDLGLALVQMPRNPKAGDTVVYELAYQNSGIVPLTNVELTLTLPAPVSFLSATGGGTANGSVVTWSFSEVAAGAQGTLEATVQVNPEIPAGALLRVAAGATVDGVAVAARATEASATVSSQGCTLTAQCDDGEICDDTTNECIPHIVAKLEVNPTPVRRGEFMMTTLTVSNPGPRTETVDVLISLPLPIFSVGAANRLEGATCGASCGGGDTVSWRVDVAAGESETIWLRPRVTTTVLTTPNGTNLGFTANVSTTRGFDTQQTASTVINNERALNLIATANASPVTPGSDLTYTIYYGNQSSDPLDDVALTFEVPVGSSHESTEDTLVFDLGRIPAGAGGTREVTVTVDNSVALGSQLEASARIEEVGAPAEASRAIILTPVSRAPLTANLSVNPDPVRRGELMDVSVTVTNPGTASETADVTVLLPLPIFAVGTANRLVGGDCGASCGGGDSVTWTIDLAPGESEVIWLRPRLTTTVSTTPEARLVPFEVLVRPSDDAPLRTSAATRINTARELNLRVEESRNPAVAGEDLIYTIHYGNQSGDPLDDVELTFNVPVGASHASAQESVILDLGRIPAGAGGTRRVTVTPDASLPNGAQLVAVTQIMEVGNTSETSRTVTQTPVGAAPVLLANVTVNPDPVRRGELMDVSVTVTNPGTASETADVTVLLPLPIFAVGTANRLVGGDCGASCGGGDSVTWTIDLAPGESEVIWLRPRLTTTVSTTPEARLVPFDVRVRPSNEVPLRTSASTRINTARALNLRVEESRNPAVAGEDLIYTIHYGNQSGDPLDDVELTFNVPEGASHASAQDTVVFDLGILGAGVSGSQSVTVAVDGSLAPSAQLRAITEITESANPSETSVAITQTAASQTPLNTSVSIVEASPVPRGTVLTVNVEVENTSASVKTVDVTVLLPLPIFAVAPLDRTGNGSCGASCGGGDSVTWRIDINPGATELIFLRPRITTTISSTPDALLVPFDAIARPTNEVPMRASDTMALLNP